VGFFRVFSEFFEVLLRVFAVSEEFSVMMSSSGKKQSFFGV
jgi:hypothetical protein